MCRHHKSSTSRWYERWPALTTDAHWDSAAYGNPPLACADCHSIGAEAAIALLGDGWEIEGSRNDPYKFYMYPPGYLTAINRFLRSIYRALKGLDDEEPLPGHVGLPPRQYPSPPVIIRTTHFNEPQFEELVNVIAKRKSSDAGQVRSIL